MGERASSPSQGCGIGLGQKQNGGGKKTPLDKERFFPPVNSYTRQISEKNLIGLACSCKTIILLWKGGPQGRFRLTKTGSREWEIDRDRRDNH